MIRRLLIIFLLLAVPLGVAGSFVGYLLWPTAPQNIEIEIPRGEPLHNTATLLKLAGVIRWPKYFLVYAKLKGVTSKIEAGDYLFDHSTTPVEVLDRLVRGDVATFPVTIIEGWTARQIADYLKGVIFLRDPNFAERFLVLSAGLEGTLFPDTYQLARSATPEELIRTMTDHFKTVYAKEVAPLIQNSGWTPAQILTLASIVEKETGAETERPLIAGVFAHRLKIGMPLQSDPTIIYGLKNFDGNLRKADMSNPHPYNTYVHAGLPPGPICNPGLAALKAAADPTATDDLFFVSKGDGTHFFSKTISEHQAAVRKYQLK